MASETTSKHPELILTGQKSTPLRADGEILPFVVARVDREGTILQVGEGAEKLTGYRHDELLQPHFGLQLVHPNDFRVVERAIRQIGIDNHAAAHVQILTKDGRARNVEFRATANGDDFDVVVADVASGGSLFSELPLRSRYDDAEPILRNIALASPDRLSFLESSLSVIAGVARADGAHVLMLDDDDLLVSIAFWLGDDAGTIEPVVLDPNNWPEILAGRVAVITQEDSQTALNVLKRLGSAHAVLVPFRDEGDRDGAFLLEWRKAPPAWSSHDSRSIARLARLFETLWAWMESEARQRLTLSDLEDGLFNFVFDDDGSRRYALMTPQCETITGVEAGALITNRGDTPSVEWKSLVYDHDLEAFEAHEDQLRRGERSQLEYRMVRPDTSELLWIRESATPSRGLTGHPLIGGLISDITERKRAEATLLQAKHAAEQASKAKTAFMATMSHEIRSPLGAIRGFTELLAEEVRDAELNGVKIPEQIEEFAQIISENTLRVLHLVHNLFDLSRLETGALELQQIPVELHPVIERVLLRYMPTVEEKGLSVVFEQANEEPTLLGDPERIEQIVEHLISNAVKFTETGEIAVSTRQIDGKVEFEVRDTGIGIAPEYLEELFEPFSQEDYRLNRAYEGSGLGLAITKKLLDGMNGSIEAESTKGEGSRFTVTFHQNDQD
ncbi:MAG: ATP-binding protein [Rubricoccaceae bacterium]|nr:ATP-binding protein [Rubricoccaceae bacterium]